VRTISGTNTGWAEYGLRAALRRRAWGAGCQEAQHELAVQKANSILGCIK